MKKLLIVTALISLHAWPTSAQAQTLGRLFFTPQERRQIDMQRNAKPLAPPRVAPLARNKPQIAQLITPEPPAPKQTIINGFVRRSDGPNTVWLNEKPISGNAAREEWLQPSAVNSPVRVQSSGR